MLLTPARRPRQSTPSIWSGDERQPQAKARRVRKSLHVEFKQIAWYLSNESTALIVVSSWLVAVGAATSQPLAIFGPSERRIDLTGSRNVHARQDGARVGNHRSAGWRRPLHHIRRFPIEVHTALVTPHGAEHDPGEAGRLADVTSPHRDLSFLVRRPAPEEKHARHGDCARQNSSGERRPSHALE